MKQRTLLLIGPATNTHVQRWTVALQARGWRVSIVSTEPIFDPPPAWLRNVPCYVVPTASARMSAAQRIATLLRGWGRVPGLVAALKPDLVHVHSLPTPAAMPFLRLVPHMVVSAWGSDVVQRDRRKARWYPRLLAHAARVTTTSHYLADVVRSYLPRAVDIVPFGVDVHRFVPPAQPPTDLRIGTLRHLEPIYGIDMLLEAVPIINATIHQQIPLQIGGAGGQAAALRARAAARGVDHQVQWWGRIPHEAVPLFLQQLSVFAMPSRAESFGVAALEAQACGVPVVATGVGGLAEVVRPGETGLLVPPDDPRALAEAIAALLLDDEWRAALGAAARRWVAERYRWETSVALMEAVYRNVY